MDKINCKVPFGTMNLPMWSKSVICHTLAEEEQVTNGKYVKRFEEEFAKAFRAKHAIAVSSGTDANTICVAALVERGGEVIIPALTFVATANAVVNAGCIPRFVDVDDTLNIDPVELENAIGPNTKAIMIVHLMGKPCNMHAIMKILEKHPHIQLIEDCAEAHGASYYAMPVGSFGKMACYSLYAAHIVSSIEGGMITTNDDALAEKCRELRNHGLKLEGSNWTFNQIGFSSKMNELEAIVGIGNLHDMDKILANRRMNFEYLTKMLSDYSDLFYTIKPGEYDIMGPHAFAIVVNHEVINKQHFVDFLTSKGIDNRNLFYSIPTQAKCYAYLGYELGRFPTAEYMSDYGTHIGIHQDLTNEQLDYVVASIKEYVDVNKPNRNSDTSTSVVV